MATVLVVEDEPAIAESLAYSLRRDGFLVELCATLAEAQSAAERADLVILDLMLPDGSGFDLLAALRRRPQPPAVIILSSRDGEADRVAGLETGADDYVTKPFSPREVVARVRAVLRRTGARDVAAPGALPLSVDPDTRRATVDGRPIELTRVEFDLLACLLGAPGRVFTRAQLIDRVWGEDFAITDRTVDSHVKALRRKVAEAGGSAQLIETVRGVGYRVGGQPAVPEGGATGGAKDGGGAEP
ncbi:MAG: response regulator transcription factor [Deltaproteobacteria bacterium]|nr:response regulator transcription factor [Deltaproteobacteria bacterium]